MSNEHPHDVAMFMSCDVVGSTAFKGSAGHDGWLEAFEALFRELPLVFIGEVAQAFFTEDDVPAAGVWKVMGDEVILLATPAGLREAALLASAFQRTVVEYDRRLAARWPLRIRGCCWAAEVGRRNRQIEIPEMFGGSNGRPYLDFLGPDIDTGFRLSACCSAGEVIVSPNLAEALARSADGTDLRFRRTGERVLKGVCGGHPFPLVLLAGDADSETTGAEGLADELRMLRQRLRDDHGVEMAPPVFERDHAVC